MTPTPPRRPERRVIPLLAAVAGVVVAHVLDYLVVFPNASARDGHLQATGHAYWPVALGAAAAAGALALIAVAARGAARGAVGLHAALRTDLRLGTLLVVQVGAFVAMEAGERAVVGLPPSILLHSPEFWFGLALQLPVAWFARRVLGGVEAVAHRVATTWAAAARPRRHTRLARPTSSVPAPPAALVASPARPRAPPCSLVTT